MLRPACAEQAGGSCSWFDRLLFTADQIEAYDARPAMNRLNVRRQHHPLDMARLDDLRARAELARYFVHFYAWLPQALQLVHDAVGCVAKIEDGHFQRAVGVHVHGGFAPRDEANPITLGWRWLGRRASGERLKSVDARLEFDQR